MVRVQFFGHLADIAGRECAVSAEEGDTARLLLARIANDNHALLEALTKTRFRFAVNDAFVPFDEPVNDGDVLAVLPPFSGG